MDRSKTFEESFTRLQQTIEGLEEGGLALEESLRLFEESMALATECNRILDQAELRLTRLVEEHAGVLEDVDEE